MENNETVTAVQLDNYSDSLSHKGLPRKWKLREKWNGITSSFLINFKKLDVQYIKIRHSFIPTQALGYPAVDLGDGSQILDTKIQEIWAETLHKIMFKIEQEMLLQILVGAPVIQLAQWSGRTLLPASIKILILSRFDAVKALQLREQQYNFSRARLLEKVGHAQLYCRFHPNSDLHSFLLLYY